MFGRKNGFSPELRERPMRPSVQPALAPAVATKLQGGNGNISLLEAAEKFQVGHQTDQYYELKAEIFTALLEIIDVSQLTKMEADRARAEIREVVNELVVAKNVAMSAAERQELLDDMCNDILGYGPLQPLLARDDIADIMVNGTKKVFIEVKGKVHETNVRFRDPSQLLSVCQRIVGQIGRRVDESSPICDARLPDGSRVNVIAPPLAIDGTTLTIRKFKKDKLTLDQLIELGSISPSGAEILRIIGRVRCN